MNVHFPQEFTCVWERGLDVKGCPRRTLCWRRATSSQSRISITASAKRPMGAYYLVARPRTLASSSSHPPQAHLPNPNNLHRDSAALAGQRVGIIVNFQSHHFFCIMRRHLGRCGARSILFVHRDYPIILFSFIPGPITTFRFFCRRRWIPRINMVSTTTIRTQSWVGRGLRSSQIPVLQHFI